MRFPFVKTATFQSVAVPMICVYYARTDPRFLFETSWGLSQEIWSLVGVLTEFSLSWAYKVDHMLTSFLCICSEGTGGGRGSCGSGGRSGDPP